MRIIDADRVEFLVKCCNTYHGVIAIDTVNAILKDVSTINTKQVKYYDEDEQVWKIGEVIVNCSEKPNNSTTEDCSTVDLATAWWNKERSSE